MKKINCCDFDSYFDQIEILKNVQNVFYVLCNICKKKKILFLNILNILNCRRQAFEPEIKNPRARELVDRWRNVWLLAMERQRRLQDKLNYLKEVCRCDHKFKVYEIILNLSDLIWKDGVWQKSEYGLDLKFIYNSNSF